MSRLSIQKDKNRISHIFCFLTKKDFYSSTFLNDSFKFSSTIKIALIQKEFKRILKKCERAKTFYCEEAKNV